MTYNDDDQSIYDFIYVAQRFINTIINFIVNIDFFVSNIIIVVAQFVLNIIFIFSSIHIQIEIIFETNNRIIIKLIQHCIHRDKNYHIEKICEFKHSHLIKKRERRTQNDKNKKCLKTMIKKNKKNEKNNKNNDKFKNKILNIVKTFFVVNFDFIMKNAFIIVFRIVIFFCLNLEFRCFSTLLLRSTCFQI